MEEAFPVRQREMTEEQLDERACNIETKARVIAWGSCLSMEEFQTFVTERGNPETVAGTQRKGREITRGENCPLWRRAIGKEWATCTKHEAAELVSREKTINIPKEQRITSRFVFTDKNEVAPANIPDLPLAPVVRGFQENALGSFGRDAPTGSQFAQHLVALIASSKRWNLEFRNVEAACFHGEKMQKDRAFTDAGEQAAQGTV